jgi:chromate reductase, NAD(P)H dehydrogenase (quinone)
MIRIIAISGSLRKRSSNSALLRAAAVLAPEGVEVSLYGKLGELPLFNPDLDGADLEGTGPAPVLDFRAHLAGADAILIASPEYAHGVTGVLKNALDWVVGSGEFTNKPVGLLNGFERSIHAPAALAEIITVMGGRPVPNATRNIPLQTNIITEEEILAQPEVTDLLRTVLTALVQAVEVNGVAM